MSSKVMVGFSDADAAALSEIAHDAVAAQALITAGQTAMTRALAQARQLAEKQTAGSSGAGSSGAATDMALRSIAAELAGALRSTDRSLQRQINDAGHLVEHFPATLDAWEAGRITRAHVHLIVELGHPLPPEASAEFEQRAIARSEQDSPGRVRAELAILAERLHPRTLTERHVQAREERCVRTFPLPDGMSALTVTGPTLLIEAVYDRLTRQGAALVDARAQARERVRERRTAAAAGTTGAGGATDAAGAGTDGGGGDPDQDEVTASDTRTMDQLRADILLDCLLTTQPGADPTRTDDGPGTLGAIRAKVQVVVPALTLLGTDEHPADLVGHSPIDADTARTLTGAVPNQWERILTHPVTGTVIATDTRFAEGPLRRHLAARDRHCRFPGCRVPAIRCEADHIIDHHHGGPTHLDNLQHLCQRHHSMKQFTAWKIRHLGDGRLEWTSPLGETYIDDPPAPTVHFTPNTNDEPPPPF